MKHLTALLAVVILSACQGTPTVQTGPEAEVSFDGLHKVDASRMRNAWVKPDLNLAGYNKIKLVDAGIEYRAVRPVSRATSSGRSEFPLTEQQKARLEEIVVEVYLEELAKSKNFTLTDEDGETNIGLAKRLSAKVRGKRSEVRGKDLSEERT